MREQISFSLQELFDVHSGDFHATEELDEGVVPLVSCGETNNGVIGFYDISPEYVYSHVLTVAYNGQPLTTKFHPYEFGAKDDVAVLKPRFKMTDATLLYIATLLNSEQWRYSYGRKCYWSRMTRVSVTLPVVEGTNKVDQDYIQSRFKAKYQSHIPAKKNVSPYQIPDLTWKSLNVEELLEIQRGDFHSLAALDKGNIVTVSRVSTNNGVVGYFDCPAGANIYPKGYITVSTVGGDAFVQLEDFIATDNVLVCKPKHSYELPTAFFIALMLNHQKWRYFYGRQCYINKFKRVNIQMPITSDGEINEDVIKTLIERTPYWHTVTEHFKEKKG